MTQINYSIIIPHYKSPDLLMRCLASIPVREDIQVLVIDDCSPGAEKYLDTYPELSRPYLEYYSTPQGGSAGRARNIGLDHARGKWVICMDADDLFVDNMEEILAESVDRPEDVLYYNYKTVMNDDLSKEGHRSFYQRFFYQYKNDNNENDFRYRFDPMWGKIIKNTVIQEHQIRCDETPCGNDIAFSFKCGVYAKTIAVVDKPFFIITEREGTLAASQFTESRVTIKEYITRLGVFLNLCKYIDDKKLFIKYRPYPTYAYNFKQDYPKDFRHYYFEVMIPKYRKEAFWTFVYFVYFALRGPQKQE